jgi:hypothetical protein
VRAASGRSRGDDLFVARRAEFDADG